MPRINQSVEEIRSNEDGKIISKNITKVLSWGDEPAYIKLYLQDVMYLSDMPKRYVAVTEALLKRVSFAGDEDGMCVTLVPRIKKSICNEMGWKTTASLDNALQKLLAGKIIYRVDRSMYRFNPYLFGKGDWQDISRLRLEIDYSEISGRSFQANIEYNNDESISDEDEGKTNTTNTHDHPIHRTPEILHGARRYPRAKATQPDPAGQAQSAN